MLSKKIKKMSEKYKNLSEGSKHLLKISLPAILGFLILLIFILVKTFRPFYLPTYLSAIPFQLLCVGALISTCFLRREIRRKKESDFRTPISKKQIVKYFNLIIIMFIGAFYLFTIQGLISLIFWLTEGPIHDLWWILFDMNRVIENYIIITLVLIVLYINFDIIIKNEKKKQLIHANK